jgi:hypothetical protein
MWKNTVQRGRPQMTIWRMRIACWLPKATDTHSEDAIVIVFPSRQCDTGSIIAPQCYIIRTLPVCYEATSPLQNPQTCQPPAAQVLGFLSYRVDWRGHFTSFYCTKLLDDLFHTSVPFTSVEVTNELSGVYCSPYDVSWR